MKKLSIFLVAVMLLTLCGCPAQEETPTTPPTAAATEAAVPQVHITVGEITPGMTAKDVLAEVTIDNRPVACRVQLTGFAWDGYWEMAADEPVPESFFVRVDIFYSLPKGCDVEDVDITMDCDGGYYDGTGSISNDDEGNIEAWSRAFYGEEPLPPETEPTEAPTQPTEPQPTEPQPTEPQPTEPEEGYHPTFHAHFWVENMAGPISCTTDSVITYSCTCGQTKQETIPAPGHDMRDGAVTQPTCTEVGTQTKRCSRCSYALVIETPATGHTWSDWEHATGRVHKHTCITCGAEETEEHKIPAGDVVCTECGAAIIN